MAGLRGDGRMRSIIDHGAVGGLSDSGSERLGFRIVSPQDIPPQPQECGEVDRFEEHEPGLQDVRLAEVGKPEGEEDQGVGQLDG